MSIFVRAPKPQEVDKFKKSLSRWSREKSGALVSNLGEHIRIEDSKNFEVFVVKIETLVEDRVTEEKSAPSKKNALPVTPTVAHGSTNVWNKPSPQKLALQFQETSVSEEIPGTEFYVPCKTCGERGHTDCMTCSKTGKLVCGQCHGTKKHDCHDCGGYGFFNCTNCNNGMVASYCLACDHGKIDCTGCDGRGSTFSMTTAKSTKCHLCNGSGKKTCLVCGGSDTQMVPCSQCNNGSLPCQTCRTQKVVTCTTCDPNGRVNCSSCAGKAVLNCTPCQTLGGFRHVENLIYKTAIETNEMTLSAFENIRDTIRLSFQGEVEITEPRLTFDQIKSNIPQAELLGPIEQIHTHVNQNRPNSTLLEKFKLEKASALEVTFKYEEEPGHALYDLNSELLYVDVNPLKKKASSSREALKTAYQQAKSKENILEARKQIERAKQLKLSDLESRWKLEIDDLEKQIRIREATAFRKTVMVPVLYGLGPAVWLVAGFITPMSLTSLLLFSFFGLVMAEPSSLKLEDGKGPLQKLFKTNLIKMGLVLLSVVLVGMGLQYFNSQDTTERIFKNGAPLTGEQQ